MAPTDCTVDKVARAWDRITMISEALLHRVPDLRIAVKISDYLRGQRSG